jgi:predicted O-methyltransferase YrrM
VPRICKELVCEAASRPDFGSPFKLELKGSHSPVTCANRAELRFVVLANHVSRGILPSVSRPEVVGQLLSTYRGIWARLKREYTIDEIEHSVGAIPGLKEILLYCLIRRFTPSVVLETGVAQGISSTFILRALTQSGDGRLISVDLPNYDPAGFLYPGALGKRDPVFVRKDLGPGWIVPLELRSSWTLLIGRSRDILPGITDNINMFLHDSEHSYENMTFELNWAFDRLPVGGIIVCDDIEWNRAYADFLAAHRFKFHLVMRSRKGACIKI